MVGRTEDVEVVGRKESGDGLLKEEDCKSTLVLFCQSTRCSSFNDATLFYSDSHCIEYRDTLYL